MTISNFLKSGHKGTLISAFIYSDMSFMVWVLMGPLVVFITQDLNLTESQQYTLVSIPLLAGVIFRIPVGILVDRYSPKKVGLISQLIVILMLLFAFLSNISSISGLYTLAIALGLAGTSMTVALPLSSRWYPDEYQGLVMGIAGAASSGTIFAAALGPMLAESFGWRAVFGFALLPLIATIIYFYLNTKDSDQPSEKKPLSDYLQVVKEVDVLWFMLFYSLSFGGVIALSSVMVLYFYNHYQIDPVTAGYYTAACILAGTSLRPVGGWIADKFGGIKSMQRFFAVTAISMLFVSFSLPSWLALILLITGTGSLGMASGAVFQLVPLRFRNNVGSVTGLIGAAGGLGGFFLAWVIGQSKQMTDSFALGFLIFTLLSILSIYGIQKVKSRWRTTWGAGEVTSARV
ncbi:MAG: MFS transporter [Methylococcales bacterium]|jgi:NNP family nitrate/nitrite transporter-like MFS transporter|nr:NarK/NasA family nitrate transporter [Methylococcaceae bacterium]